MKKSIYINAFRYKTIPIITLICKLIRINFSACSFFCVQKMRIFRLHFYA